jgi:hypothetical protein
MSVTRKTKANPSSPPDVGVLAREAVIGFLHDASKATADREAQRAAVAATDAEATVTAPAGNAAGSVGSVAWRAAAISVAALDRMEAAAAKVEADIAVALRAYAELQAGAGAAAEAAVHAAQSAMA